MIRVFPVKTKWTPIDDFAFIGDPPLFRPLDKKTPVRISVTFTWNLPEGERLVKAWSAFYDDVKLGGPACGDPGKEFVSGRYIKSGVTITSRGCPKQCPWCFVPRREGKIRELEIKPGWIVQDNNILACSTSHIEKVFTMLAEQPKAAVFSGGLDAALLTVKHRVLFDQIRINELWFACDTTEALRVLKNASGICAGISIEKLRCYVMVGYNRERIEEAERRLEQVYEMGFLPFCQLYLNCNPKVYPREWRALARKWSRPAAYRRTKELKGVRDASTLQGDSESL